MADHDFSFALECSDAGVSREMLRNLVAQVFGHCGCADHAGNAIGAIDSAVADCTAGTARPVGVSFQARNGLLSVTVLAGAHAVFQSSCPIP